MSAAHRRSHFGLLLTPDVLAFNSRRCAVATVATRLRRALTEIATQPGSWDGSSECPTESADVEGRVPFEPKEMKERLIDDSLALAKKLTKMAMRLLGDKEARFCLRALSSPAEGMAVPRPRPLQSRERNEEEIVLRCLEMAKWCKVYGAARHKGIDDISVNACALDIEHKLRTWVKL